MRATAGFHANQARHQIRKERHHLSALELFLQHSLPLVVRPMNLKNVLCQVNPNRRKLHFGRPFLQVVVNGTSTLAP